MKFKAIFLLTVFLLYHGVGLACALHITTTPAEEILITEKPAQPEISASRYKNPSSDHIHPEGTPPHEHGSHKHAQPAGNSSDAKAEIPSALSEESQKSDGCCQDDVAQINAIAKVIPKAGNDIKVPVSVINSYLQDTGFFTSPVNELYTTYVISEEYPPPQPDIRITIQSFQI